MNHDSVSRRQFLMSGVASTIVMRAGLPAFVALSQAACGARDEAAAYANLTDDEARAFIAIAARIFPTTETPGANEAGAVYFLDQAFGGPFDDLAVQFRDGLAAFQSGVSQQYQGTAQFSDLDESNQDAYLTSIEDSEFFTNARFLTLAGVFGMSMYGGNKGNVGYRLVGMDGPPHGWVSPFGEYDAEYLQEQTGDA